MGKDFRLSQAAEMLGVNRDTMKYWEDHNLIPTARRDVNDYRVYNIKEIKEIASIRGVNLERIFYEQIKSMARARDMDLHNVILVE